MFFSGISGFLSNYLSIEVKVFIWFQWNKRGFFNTLINLGHHWYWQHMMESSKLQKKAFLNGFSLGQYYKTTKSNGNDFIQVNTYTIFIRKGNSRLTLSTLEFLNTKKNFFYEKKGIDASSKLFFSLLINLHHHIGCE